MEKASNDWVRRLARGEITLAEFQAGYGARAGSTRQPGAAEELRILEEGFLQGTLTHADYVEAWLFLRAQRHEAVRGDGPAATGA